MPREERLAKWEQLYGEPGFGIWLANFRDTFMDEEANAELSEFIAGKIRSRVHDPAVAEKLIPKDHGFGVQRVPMETGYYEAYNQENVHLVDLRETPISAHHAGGHRDQRRHRARVRHHRLRHRLRRRHRRLRPHRHPRRRRPAADGTCGRASPVTFLGLTARVPEHADAHRSPERVGVDELPARHRARRRLGDRPLQYMWKHDYTRVDATPEARPDWSGYVAKLYEIMLMRKAQGWFTGYNSNVDGHEKGTIRYVVFNGGTPKYRQKIAEVADDGYRGLVLTQTDPAF